MKKKIEPLIIQANSSILNALKQMDKSKHKLLIVVKDNTYQSVLSIGDIQRAIIANVDLSTEINSILRKDVKVASVKDNLSEVKDKMKTRRNEFMPVISSNNEVLDVIFWKDLFDQTEKIQHTSLKLPVVIMAGGKGSRLYPITNVLPKPLIPLGERPILEEIMDKFVGVGCNTFHLSVNYKAETIKHHFRTLDKKAYNISYIEEPKPLGTAGSLFLVKDKINSTFFVSNCDILIDQDLEDVYNYHIKNKNVITIVSVLKHYKIPYGTIETLDEGVLKKLHEKPELTFQINSGLYILEPAVLEEIPENSFFHITALIDKVQESGQRVGVFPVSEGSWKDIGEWEEYIKAINNG